MIALNICRVLRWQLGPPAANRTSGLAFEWVPTVDREVRAIVSELEVLDKEKSDITTRYLSCEGLWETHEHIE